VCFRLQCRFDVRTVRGSADTGNIQWRAAGPVPLRSIYGGVAASQLDSWLKLLVWLKMDVAGGKLYVLHLGYKYNTNTH